MVRIMGIRCFLNCMFVETMIRVYAPDKFVSYEMLDYEAFQELILGVASGCLVSFPFHDRMYIPFIIGLFPVNHHSYSCCCGQQFIQELPHVTFQYSRYEAECSRFLRTIISRIQGRSNQEELVILLADI